MPAIICKSLRKELYRFSAERSAVDEEYKLGTLECMGCGLSTLYNHDKYFAPLMLNRKQKKKLTHETCMRKTSNLNLCCRLSNWRRPKSSGFLPG